jgi:hypothetical protein
MHAGPSPDRAFSAEYLRLRALALAWIGPYYDCAHLTQAATWALALDADASEPLLLAALTHDMERSVPGGPFLDKATEPWDDVEYNRSHCERSADIVCAWLRRHGAAEAFVTGVREPIRRHEFGGGTEGDLMQAADSLSFLEVNGRLVASWVLGGECDLLKGELKLRWMFERIRLEPARALARPLYDAAMEDLHQRLDVP